MNTITKEQLIEELKASTQNAGGMFEISEDTICALMSMLIATPSPVVPDEMTPKQASRSYCGEVRGYRDGWNACRAAMIQGAESVSQPCTLRDEWVAVPVEMTPEQMRAVQLNSELGSYTVAKLTGAYSLFREFWDVAISAAPQQEANK